MKRIDIWANSNHVRRHFGEHPSAGYFRIDDPTQEVSRSYWMPQARPYRQRIPNPVK
jgi:hypothetical protein